jgi:hypothetical protein
MSWHPVVHGRGLPRVAVTIWRDGLIIRLTNYTDIDDARAAAERLTQERADA